MGRQKTPIEHYLRKPGVTYDSEDPNLNPDRRIDNAATDSKDGYKPSDVPAASGADSGTLRPIPKLDVSKLPPPPMKP